MRLKLTINVNQPLKKQWQIRSNTGNYVTIKFKYERLGGFFYRCGLLDHTGKVCPNLFELDSDDGVREWGVELRPSVHRFGTAATIKWIQDPIPNVVPQTGGNSSGTQLAATNISTESTSDMSNLGGRLTVVHNEVSATKHGILVAQKSVLSKNGKATSAVHINHAFPSSSSCLPIAGSQLFKPIVLGIPAATFSITGVEDNTAFAEPNNEEVSSDLKKRKRILAECLKSSTPPNDTEFSFAAEGVNGDYFVGENVSGGDDHVMNICDNPLYENQNVSAGSDDQAYRVK
jgi:hypothetical protein